MWCYKQKHDVSRLSVRSIKVNSRFGDANGDKRFPNLGESSMRNRYPIPETSRRCLLSFPSS